MKATFNVTIETDKCDDPETRERVAAGLALLAGHEPSKPGHWPPRVSHEASGGAAIDLSCTAMDRRLAKGPVMPVLCAADIEPETGTLIAHGHLPAATLRDQVVEKVDWRGHSLGGLHFLKCRFALVDFTSADLRGASFVDCTFEECRFDDADIAGCTLHACALNRCSALGARWTGAEVSRCDMDLTHHPNWPDAYRNNL